MVKKKAKKATKKTQSKKTGKKVAAKAKTTTRTAKTTATKRKTKDPTTSAALTKSPDKKITQSLASLGKELAFVAYQSALNSGDYYSYKGGNGGTLSDLWADYWEKNYKYLFFAAVYALKDDLQKHPDIRSAVVLARNEFLKVLKRGEKECFESYKKNKKVSTDNRLAKLKYFNGAKVASLPRPSSFKVMEKQINKDRWF